MEGKIRTSNIEMDFVVIGTLMMQDKQSDVLKSNRDIHITF